jgi:hypothetical protein
LTPKLDGSPINDRVDWEHQLNPVDPPRREEVFPGLTQRVVVKDPVGQPTLFIEGYLEGSGADESAAVADMIGVFTGLDLQRADGPFTVDIHNVTFPNMDFLAINYAGKVLAAAPLPAGSPCRVLQRVRLTFRAMS